MVAIRGRSARRVGFEPVRPDGDTLPRYKSVDALQNALATTVFGETGAPKKAAGRALGTLVELVTFYMLRDWKLEQNLAIERGLPEYGNAAIRHNVEFTLHAGAQRTVVPCPEGATSFTGLRLLAAAKLAGAPLASAELRSSARLIAKGIVRHACTFAEEPGAFWVAHMTGENTSFDVSRLVEEPFAMFECKRVGVEEGQKKGPQTIEKAKQGAYVARTVSGLQRIPRRDGSVAAIVESKDGELQTHDDYYAFLQGAIDNGDLDSLANVVVTVGVVSNHGNWFTADTQHKEMKVLAQSYDWLLFLTDDGLAEFIEDVLQGDAEELVATRAAFASSFGRSSGVNQFTKVTINAAADRELTEYFAKHQPWDRWFNVITPREPITKLKDDLRRLRDIHEGTVTSQ